jgi:hypothetical protein
MLQFGLGGKDMLKEILMTLGVIVITYLQVWAADQYDQITGNAERLRRELEKDSG